MKKLLTMITIIATLILGTANAFENNITDIENHWAKENIIRMLSNEKVNGYTDHTFRPNDSITVLEFTKMALENLNIKLEKQGLQKWPDYYIATAKKYQLNDNYDEYLSRYEAVEIIAKLIDINTISKSKNTFKDLDSAHQADVLKLVKMKVFTGYEDNTFRGKEKLTRAEAVSILVRLVDARQKIIDHKKYVLDSKYTNIGVNGTDSAISKIRYEISGEHILFFDAGRFSNVQNYRIDEKYVTNQKLIRILKELITEDSYTAMYYVPSPYIINQIMIQYGENDEQINRNVYYFSFTYYEDKLYDCNRMTLNPQFSKECYLKITIKKMWKENYQMENGNYVEDTIKNKFLNALKIEFGKDAQQIAEYMLHVYEVNKVFTEDIAEQVFIGKYCINTYQTNDTNLEFYFEKM